MKACPVCRRDFTGDDRAKMFAWKMVMPHEDERRGGECLASGVLLDDRRTLATMVLAVAVQDLVNLGEVVLEECRPQVPVAAGEKGVA